MGLIISIIVGGIIGWLASLIMKSPMGILGYIIVGIVGSASGTFFGRGHRSGGLWRRRQAGRECGRGGVAHSNIAISGNHVTLFRRQAGAFGFKTPPLMASGIMPH